MIETSIISTPQNRRSIGVSSNSSLRRSLTLQKLRSNKDEERNDDDAERSFLLASEKALVASTPINTSHSSTVISSPQKEHFQGCLKLYAENKINKDNAWNLQLIDFMTSMVRRHDKQMENLQTASTLVDASARIYSYRVDAVHYDGLKIAGGLIKAAQTKRGKKDDDDAGSQDDGAAEGDAAPTKRKKKKFKSAIATNPEVFNGDFDTIDCVDPFFERLAATVGQVTSSNRAFSATLPVDDKTFALILRTDYKYLDSIKENVSDNLDLKQKITFKSKLLPAFKDTDRICEPFFGFSITNWDPETEDVDNRVNNWIEDRLNQSQQAVAFDVNAEVERIPQDEAHNDLYDDEPLGGIESDEEADVAVAAVAAVACAARVGAAPAKLADMRPLTARDSRLEYSYCGAIVSAWAGPSHWRLRNNRASKLSERTQSMATGRLMAEGKKPPRSKRQLDFMEAGMAFDCRLEPKGDYEPAQPAKIMISRKTLSTGHTWNETNFKTPIDRGLDESHFRKLFVRRNVMMLRKKDLEQSKQPDIEPVTVEEDREYDYNNENDATYCTHHVSDNYDNDDAAAAGELHTQLKSAEYEGISDMLEPPTKVAKIFIPYATRAKRIDMKQLKHQMWKTLATETPEGQETVPLTTFSSVYSQLPSKLSTSMRESLTVPLALLSMLHLANEKGLILESHEDLKDIDVKGLT